MNASKTAALDALISQLESQIRAVEHLELRGTKLLLTMARLDLQAKRHDIRDHELKALCVTIENAMNADHGRRTRPAKRVAKTRPKAVRPSTRRAPAHEPQPPA